MLTPIHFDDVAGRTVKAVYRETGEWGDITDLAIVFEDGTFAVYGHSYDAEGCYGCRALDHEAARRWAMDSMPRSAFWGIVTEAELTAEMERRQKQQARAKEESERAEYWRLRAKFAMSENDE